MQKQDEVVVLNYEDLVSGKDLSAEIEKAYGYTGIGLLAVKGVPRFVELRQNLLPLAWQYSALPDYIKDKCVHKDSHFSYGWSHGKEVLKEGKFDEHKGSYYNNPQYDVPTTDPNMIRKYPASCGANIWPTEDFPQLEPAFKELGQLMVEVGLLVAKQCDRYTKSQLPSYEENQLYSIIKRSKTCKARLLYYFPINDPARRTRDSWCGWHNDHDSLTALCPAMFYNGKENKTCPSPDAEAGLYVKTRQGNEFKVNIPPDHIAYQIGECSQILSGGLLRATPHSVQAVRWPESQYTGRATFAVFMQPDNDIELKIPEGRDIKQAAVGQYNIGQTFADFHAATVANYYVE